jgi:hypothetical protein
MSFSVDGSRPVSEAHNVKELSEFSDASDRPSDTDLEKGEVNYPEQRDKSIRCRFLFPTRCREEIDTAGWHRTIAACYVCFSVVAILSCAVCTAIFSKQDSSSSSSFPSS